MSSMLHIPGDAVPPERVGALEPVEVLVELKRILLDGIRGEAPRPLLHAADDCRDVELCAPGRCG